VLGTFHSKQIFQFISYQSHDSRGREREIMNPNASGKERKKGNVLPLILPEARRFMGAGAAVGFVIPL